MLFHLENDLVAAGAHRTRPTSPKPCSAERMTGFKLRKARNRPVSIGSIEMCGLPPALRGLVMPSQSGIYGLAAPAPTASPLGARVLTFPRANHVILGVYAPAKQ